MNDTDFVVVSQSEPPSLAELRLQNQLLKRLGTGVKTEAAVANGCGFAFCAAGQGAGTSRIAVCITASCSNIRLHYPVYQASGSSLPSYTVKASIQLFDPNNPSLSGAPLAAIPVTFNGGQTTTNPTTGPNYSDPINVHLYAGQVIFILTYCSGANNPQNRQLRTNGAATAGDFFLEGFASTDQTGTTGIGTFNSALDYQVFAPFMVTGTVQAASNNAVLLLGDSIGAHQADWGTRPIIKYRLSAWTPYLQNLFNLSIQTVNQTFQNAFVVRGWLERALVNQNAVVNMCAAGTSTVNYNPYATTQTLWFALYVAQYCRDAVLAFGANDLLSISYVTLENNLRTLATTLRKHGIRRVGLTTILPRAASPSSDGWTSIVNQNISAPFESWRIPHNAWVRSVPPGFDFFIETAQAVEDPANVGYWKIGYVQNTVASATVTGSGAGTVITNASWVGEWEGMALLVRGSTYTIATLGLSTWLQTIPAWVTVPLAGDSYQIIDGFTADGVHPSTLGHLFMANNVNRPYFA
jgi:lysophospholipase L1-like esterase